jgi:cytoskeletal protein RodZ
MSTILEALKKSEQERKLNRLPTLSDMPPPQERSVLPTVLLLVVCLLLLVILAVLGFQWWQARGSADAQQSVSSRVDTTSALSGQNGDAVLVSVVSYATDPAQRFAIVNGKMVRENEFVQPGLRVDKIDPDAVYLILRGERIKRTL